MTILNIKIKFCISYKIWEINIMLLNIKIFHLKMNKMNINSDRLIK